MIDIRLYGTATPRYEMIKRDIEDTSKSMGIDIHLEEINDVDSFLNDGIKEVPCIKVNDKIVPCSADRSYLEVLEKAQNQLTMNNHNYLKKILVPVDLQSYSNDIVDYAARLCTSVGASLHMIHVQHPTPVVAETPMPPSVLDEVQNSKQTVLDTMITDLVEKYPHIDATGEVLIGLAGNAIIDASESYDLIIMATRHDKSILERWIGTVANHVLLQSKCPVLAIPPEASDLDMKKMLFGYDEHKGGEEHISTLLKLVHNFGLQLSIAHVKNDQDDNALSELQSYIAFQFPKSDISYVEISAGSVSDGLLDTARNLHSDVLCLAKTHKSLWKYLREGNHTEHMLAKADLPLLILPRVE